MAQLILTRAAKSGSSAMIYEVLENGVVGGRIMKTADAPEGTPWRWTLLFEYHEDRAQTLGYEKTREHNGFSSFSVLTWGRVFLFPTRGIDAPGLIGGRGLRIFRTRRAPKGQ